MVAIVVLALLVVSGMTGYKVAAAKWNDHVHHRSAKTFSEQVTQRGNTANEALLAEARRWNKTVDGHYIADPFEQQKARHADGYDRQLGDPMARLTVPRLGIDLPVRHGTDEAAITTGAGHLFGTHLPVGGVGTNAVITSHRGVSSATLFDRLPEARRGDLIVVEVAGERLAYRVVTTTVIAPTELDILKPVPGKDRLTLFTCTPLWVNTHRFVVIGERVTLDDAVSKEIVEQSHDHHWWHLERWQVENLAISLVALLLAIIIVVRELTAKSRSGRVGSSPADTENTP